jgi:hypothetical protein
MFGRTLELLAELGVLGSDTNGASVPKGVSKAIKVSIGTNGMAYKWHFLIMMQPIAIRGVVAKPHSSAPRRQAIATSLPVRI